MTPSPLLLSGFCSGGVESPNVASPLLPAKSSQASSSATPQKSGQRLHEGSNFDESQCNQQKKNVTEVQTALPPIGWWVVIFDAIAQVKQHISDDVVHPDGETIFGSYRIEQFVVLTIEEMILRGLVWRRQ